MLESDFEIYLLNDENITSKNKAVSTRLSKARVVEDVLEISLDIIVSNDISMYHTLLDINKKMKNSSGAYSNAIRKYYTFKNKKIFPKLKKFKKENIGRL